MVPEFVQRSSEVSFMRCLLAEACQGRPKHRARLMAPTGIGHPDGDTTPNPGPGRIDSVLCSGCVTTALNRMPGKLAGSSKRKALSTFTE